MKLEDAMRLYPPAESPLKILTDRDHADRIIAGQMIADELRLTAAEQFAQMKMVARLRENAVEGVDSGYSMIRNVDLNAIVDYYRRRFMLPLPSLSLGTPLPPLSP